MELPLSTTHNAWSNTQRLMREEQLQRDLILQTIDSFGAQRLAVGDFSLVSDWLAGDRRTPRRLHACFLLAKYST